MTRTAKRINYKDRIPAAATCIANGWKVGDKLASNEWQAPRKIGGRVAANDISIRLIRIRPDGTAIKDEYPKTLPGDVRLA